MAKKVKRPTDERLALLQEVRDEWKLDDLKKLTIKTYTSLDNDSFSYYVEHYSKELGDIRGGSAFNRVVYAIKEEKDKNKPSSGLRYYGSEYGWKAEHEGQDVKETFENLKKKIIAIASYSSTGQLEQVEQIELGHAYKWKIAFIYQNINNTPKIIPVYKKESLIRCINFIDKQTGTRTKKTHPKMYERIIEYYNCKTIESAFKVADEIWRRWGIANQDTRQDASYCEESNNQKVTEKDKEEAKTAHTKKPKKSDSSTSGYSRNPKYGKIAIENNQYKCLYDDSHTTFISDRTGENFIEAHHLIPMEYCENYWKRDKINIDCPENIVPLCPNCHRRVHLAKSDDKEKILSNLLTKKQIDLKNINIGIGLKELMKKY